MFVDFCELVELYCMRNPNEYNNKNAKTVAIWRNIRLSVIGHDIRGATTITLLQSVLYPSAGAVLIPLFSELLAKDLSAYALEVRADISD